MAGPEEGFGKWRSKWVEAGSTGLRMRGMWGGDKGDAVEVGEDEVMALLREAHAYGLEEPVLEKARAWADGFQFPEDVRTRDVKDLKRLGYDLEALVRERTDALRPDRLNLERVKAMVDPVRDQLEDPEDYNRVCDLAVNGMRISLEAGFIPRSKPNELRKKYLATGGAVDKLIHEQYLKGTLLIIPTEDAMKIPGIHFSDQSWAAKKESDSGRVIGDLSFGGNGCNVNGSTKEGREEIRAKIVGWWTAIELPTLERIMEKVLGAQRRYGRGRVVLYKCDVKAAFNLLFFFPPCARLVVFALWMGLTVLHMVGNFGWTGTPHAWGVLMRILLVIAREKIGECFLEIFVDDFMGATDIDRVDFEMGEVTGAITGLLGPAAEAPKKNEKGRKLDLIGWTVDLDTEVVTMSRRNLLKALVAFFSIDEKGGVTLGQIEVAASLAIRYAAINRGMRVFTVSLFKDIQGYKGCRTARRHLSIHSRHDIVMWRSFLVYVGVDSTKYARSFNSFRSRGEATVFIEYDGSLEGLGIGVSRTREGQTDGKMELHGFASVFPMPYQTTDDSSYQNTQEFLAIIVGLLMCCREEWRGFTFSLAGDSVSTLSWAGHDRANSELARKASIAYSVVCVRLDATVGRTKFVRGKDNVVMDDLSRGVMDNHVLTLDQSKRVEVSAGSPIHRFVALMDPAVVLLTSSDHATLYRDLSSIVDEIEQEGRMSRGV